jgi:hypothetical protein
MFANMDNAYEADPLQGFYQNGNRYPKIKTQTNLLQEYTTSEKVPPLPHAVSECYSHCPSFIQTEYFYNI